MIIILSYEPWSTDAVMFIGYGQERYIWPVLLVTYQLLDLRHIELDVLNQSEERIAQSKE